MTISKSQLHSYTQMGHVRRLDAALEVTTSPEVDAIDWDTLKNSFGKSGKRTSLYALSSTHFSSIAWYLPQFVIRMSCRRLFFFK